MIRAISITGLRLRFALGDVIWDQFNHIGKSLDFEHIFITKHIQLKHLGLFTVPHVFNRYRTPLSPRSFSVWSTQCHTGTHNVVKLGCSGVISTHTHTQTHTHTRTHARTHARTPKTRKVSRGWREEAAWKRKCATHHIAIRSQRVDL